MRRKRPNPFTVLLGIVGIAFTITASAFCVSVLRGVSAAKPHAPPQAFDRLLARHGTTALVVELALLAVATFGSIAVDEMGHREVRKAMREKRRREGDDGGAGP